VCATKISVCARVSRCVFVCAVFGVRVVHFFTLLDESRANYRDVSCCNEITHYLNVWTLHILHSRWLVPVTSERIIARDTDARCLFRYTQL